SILFILLTSFLSLSAQAEIASGTDWLTYGLIASIAVIVLFFVVQVGDSFLSLEAKRIGVDQEEENVSIFPKWSEIFSPRLPNHLDGKRVIRLKKGHDILLEGAAKGIPSAVKIKSFAVQPKNFIGMSPIPKVEVEVGQKVVAGDELFFDKKRPEIKYVSPVSGEVAAVNRAEKRSIAEVVILADSTIEYKKLNAPNVATASREDLVNFLLESGGWTMLRQRPYNIPAEHDVVPRDIFISTFDSAPLAPDSNVVISGQQIAFQKGLDVLKRLTEGKVYLGLEASSESEPSPIFTEAVGVEKYYFQGKHPAGNVGVQIHHIAPLAAGDTVWTLGIQEVLTLGNLFVHNRFDASRIIAVAGAEEELEEAKYVKTYLGANVGELVKGNVKHDNTRLVSGDVLSGQQKASEHFLNYYDDQVTVLAEGDDYELFGWLLPITPRPSISNTFPNFIFPDQKFVANTNTHGEKRAFVMSSDYEEVMPMDVYVQSLMKAIMVNDFERMEGLGLTELVEEDVALCEFVCVSKMPLQKILREGLDEMRAQG
ncbi:MAG: Na(+)-translocating NADH-quinone reductase subunit A, partial [Bacteroidota bacterium]